MAALMKPRAVRRNPWDGVSRLGAELQSATPQYALFSAACDALQSHKEHGEARVLFKHNGRAWWASMTGRSNGLALVALYASRRAPRAAHAAIVADPVTTAL